MDLKQLDEKMREPHVTVSLIDHLVSIGQIEDTEWVTWTQEQKIAWVKARSESPDK